MHTINLKSPYTLDLHKDGSSPTRKTSELQVMKNYQSKPGAMFVRKGITIFTFTAK